jgi:isocitrate/isopropylmalate dehydrogenase
MSAVMMLNHMGDELADQACTRSAERIKNGYNQALQLGKLTRDLGGNLDTEAFAGAVIQLLDA